MPSSPDVLYSRLLARARLRHLQLLVAIADHGSVKRAAERIGMSQPAATQAIRELELLLEVALFERQARGMRVSEAGQAVLPVVRQALQALEASLEALAAARAGASGLLRVGVIPAAAVSLVGSCLPTLNERHPRLQVVIFEGTPAHLLKELAAGSLHAVVARRPAQLGERFHFEPLGTDEAIVIAGAGHPLAGRAEVSFDELLDYPWMRAPASVKVRDLFDDLFANRTPPATHLVSSSSPTVILALLRDDRTVTLAPASIADWYVEQGLVVRLPVTTRFPLPGLGILYPAASRDQPATAAFVEALRSGQAGHRTTATPPSP